MINCDVIAWTKHKKKTIQNELKCLINHIKY